MFFGPSRARQASRIAARWLTLSLVAFLLGGACLPREISLPFARSAADEAASVSGRPPLTPRWAYEPWIWEDEENTAEAVRALVDDYRRRDIPVGAVIVDSPWQTNYNTFEFNADYPDPAGLIRDLHAQDVRVLLWATGFINVSSIDGPGRGKAATYDEAYQAGYFVDGGRTYDWDKGKGSAVDFFNPEAVAWWYRQMDRAFATGVDGWKVDSPEGNLPDLVQTAAGPKTQREYGDAYYRAFYRYVAERNPDAIITARPYDGGTVYAPVEANPAGWVGDQIPDWGPRGIEEALDNILASAELGYAVVGSDIGGYRPGTRFDRLFARWTQLGALSPLMENGGRGEHRPWKLDDELVPIYRYYAKLHHQLVPYLYSAGVEAHRTGRPIIRDVDRTGRQYLLGEDLLVAPIVTRADEREVSVPAGGRWYDYWDDERVLSGPATTTYRASVARIPLLIRGGAIIPLQVEDGETGHGGRGSAGHLTVLAYPDESSERVYNVDAERSVTFRSRRDADGVRLELGPHDQPFVVRVKEPVDPGRVLLERAGSPAELGRLPSWEAFDGAAEGWYYDAARRYLWARFGAPGASATLTYAARP